ncbi:MAG: fasciclin domain-containing protein [Bacteroidetes bacterium]|nr:fasciclin domain-containing protein [Bacteroidota bacterium]
MKATFKFLFVVGTIGLFSCSSEPKTEENGVVNSDATAAEESNGVGQSGVQDDVSNPNVVQVAVSSKDHTTLVAAVKAAELVDVLSNAGPFTVFAPVNAAFDKLPAGTVEGLLKPEKKDALVDILQYHVYVGVIEAEALTDGRNLGQVNGGNIKISVVDGKPVINGKAHVVASIKASNGIIHVIDEVLLPQ